MIAALAPDKQPRTERTFLGPKLLRASHLHGYPGGGIGFFCPACRVLHVIPPGIANAGTPAAPDFPGDFTESWRGLPLPGDPVPGDQLGLPALVPAGRCHYRIVAGFIHFERDSTHRLAGITVPLPDLPGHLRE